jgi:hypothetical protein
MIRMSARRTVTAVATLCFVGGGLAIAAPAANADTLVCLAKVTAVQNINNTAISDDAAGNTAAAASEDAGAAASFAQAESDCYFNPAVTYLAYTNAVGGFTYVNAALSDNNAGNAAAGLADGRTAAGFLATAIRDLNTGP